jgi:hypothetical protein
VVVGVAGGLLLVLFAHASILSGLEGSGCEFVL